MKESVIRHSLDLSIRLIDTSTGAEVEERQVRFWKDGQPVRPVPKGSGNYAFLNCGREDCELEVKVYGYESCRMEVRYEALDSQLPVMEVFLIPSENTARGQPVITFSGILPGLEEVQAVDLGKIWCSISGFDERKRIMTLFKPHRSRMDDIYYGLIHVERQDYEPFTVVEEISEKTVKISQPLKEPYSVNAPVSRVVFGKVTPEGEYCIRVRDDSEHLKYLVRYVVEGNVRFKTIDFHQLEEVALE